jgi:N4-gp56 family major capsid protein
MATFTSAANTGTTEDQVISSIVQEELLQASMLRPTVTDLSSMAQKGVKAIDWPRFSSNGLAPAAQNADGTTETAGQTAVFAVDTINLSDWTSIPYEIPDRVSQQTMINLEAELARSAGRHYGEYMDTQILVQLRLASASAPDHERDLDGNATQGVQTAITLDGIAIARQLLNRANVPQSDRYMVIPPEQEKVLIGLDNFRNADKYGSREALLKGEIGQIYGFRVIVHNGAASNEAFAYHKTAVAVAVQQEVQYETRRSRLGLQKTEYCFSMGMGQKVLDGGRRQVHMLGA